MDDTKLVIVWDEVLEDLVRYIFEELTKFDQNVIKDRILTPLMHMMLSELNVLYKLFLSPSIYTFSGEIIERIGFILYLFCLGSIALKIFYILLQHIGHFADTMNLYESLSIPLKRLTALHCLHFIGIPIVQEVLVKLPKFLQQLSSLFFGMRQPHKLALETQQYTVSLSCFVFISIIFVSLICVIVQFANLSFKIVLSFFQTYIHLMKQGTMEEVFLPLKSALIRSTVIFILQQILILEGYLMIVKGLEISNICMVAAVSIVTVTVPTIVRKGS